MKKLSALLLILLLLLPAAVRAQKEEEPGRVAPTYTVSPQYAASIYSSYLSELTLTGNQRLDLLNVALSQVGYHEGDTEADLDGSNYYGDHSVTEYGRWFGLEILGHDNGFYYDWCAMFVAWCARQARVPLSTINNATYAHIGVAPFYFHMTYHPRGTYMPKPGDLIFYDWFNNDRMWDHVGIVALVRNGMVYAVEGNTLDRVRIRVIDVDYVEIQGWGVPAYTSASDDFLDLSKYTMPSRTLAYGASGDDVKWLQAGLLLLGYASPIDGGFGLRTLSAVKQFQKAEGLDQDGVFGPHTRSRLKELLSITVQDPADPLDPSSYPVPIRTLKVGSKGDDVKWLQATLRMAGANIAVDGDFGELTRVAVEVFQSNHGLIVDGLVGPTTRTKLINILGVLGPSANFPEPTRVLRKGMRGEDVKWLQANLTRLGFITEVDGAFGPGTEAKVIEFQRNSGLDQDGAVGPATIRAIKDRFTP